MILLAKLVINTWNKKSHINKNIYGHFSEHIGRGIYGGIYVGDDPFIKNVNGMRCDVVEALRHIRVPVLRWPGGCFADYYHWKDGIGPREYRKRMVNTNWGGVVEDNSFGTHEYMELCRQLKCEPYICGNVGSGTVEEMSEWIEYLTCDGISPMAELRAKNGRSEPWKIKYWGIGNENWGCGGHMTPTQYGEMYRRYRTFCRNYSGNELYCIASGPDGADYEWTEGVMKTAAYFRNHRLMDALTLHYYTQPNTWQKKKLATVFDQRDYFKALERSFYIEELIIKHCEIMSRYDPDHKIGLIIDEWGAWYEVEPGTNPAFLYQQNTMRDALIAAVHFDVFNRHSDRVVMANLAQMVNVIQSVILTEGNKMLLTPTYHAFDLYSAHQDATLIDSWLETEEIGKDEIKIPSLSHSVSEKDGVITITASNLSLNQSIEFDCYLLGYNPETVTGRILAADMDAYNTFDKPNNVAIMEFTDILTTNYGLKWTLPPCSVVEISLNQLSH
jgi:alpha-N-arabinofuranosidase